VLQCLLQCVLRQTEALEEDVSVCLDELQLQVCCRVCCSGVAVCVTVCETVCVVVRVVVCVAVCVAGVLQCA